MPTRMSNHRPSAWLLTPGEWPGQVRTSDASGPLGGQRDKRCWQNEETGLAQVSTPVLRLRQEAERSASHPVSVPGVCVMGYLGVGESFQQTMRVEGRSFGPGPKGQV